VWDSYYLVDVANLALALSLEALLGCRAAFDPRIHIARGHPGQIRIASQILSLIDGSKLVDSTNRVQDAYSLRCAPQVHGAVLDTVDFCAHMISREINAATDNPLIFHNSEVVSGGNFHGEPIGFGMDFLSIAMCKLAGISERRIFRLIDSKLNGGLPPMLVDNFEKAGLHSGLMMPHYTAASLVLESQTLATPDSIKSLPTAGEQEDHNANSMTAARHARDILENVTHVLAIELFTACRALDIRMRQLPDKGPGKITRMLHDAIRKIVPYKADDSLWAPDIEKIHQWIKSGDIRAILANID
jgi:histidine ammonia-lyase